MKLVERARLMASMWHALQKYGEHEYTVHLDDVVKVLKEFGFADDHEMLAAGYLHDVLEDTYVAHNIILEEFGRRVYELVKAVTNEPGANRKERAVKTYPKIRENEEAVALKLADRISNVRQVGKMLAKYKAEYPDFKAALYRVGEYDEMWVALDFWMK